MPLTTELLERIDAYWRAANYLSAGQIYLKDNPLLEEPLKLEHVKSRLLGHWGTTPGLNFIYVHLNRLIQAHDLNMLFIAGPGHGGPGLVANAYLEGTYSERWPAIERNREGLKRLFRQFSWPGGISSHAGPELPGSMHEGGELGYSLAHAFGAAFDNPDLIVACVVGDGEAETGPLAASWHSNKFLNPKRDGAVLPILHLNGYKIANPTVLARITRQELENLFHGYGYEAFLVEGSDPFSMHRDFSTMLDRALARIHSIQDRARRYPMERPLWPMIILRSPKGWTGPKTIDGLPVEGTWRSHQVPIPKIENDQRLRLLEDWLLSYRPRELFDGNGRLRDELAELSPRGNFRMSDNRHANGGELLKPLDLPRIHSHSVTVSKPGSLQVSSTQVLGGYLRDVLRLNKDLKNFRIFGPDETASNRLQAVFEASGKCWMAETLDTDVNLDQAGQVMEILSEHLCQGWLEGYILTGRHGFFSSYEAFIHIVDSMFNQHAKWLKVSNAIPWRKPVASLNYLLSSHVWRQDHNGFSHQDPGFLDVVANKKAEIVRIYLPPDANCLLAVTDHCLRSRNYVNVIVAGKQPEFQWLDINSAISHCAKGIGAWDWAGNCADTPDVILACAGDVPTVETLAAATLLSRDVPDMRIRVVNVVDLMTLQPAPEHPHGLSKEAYDDLFPPHVPVVFAFHGYPTLIHKLTYKRANHEQLHVQGYREEGTTTTPFDMAVLNGIDRYSLAFAAVKNCPKFAKLQDAAIARHSAMMQRHRRHVEEFGVDLPEVADWRWQ